MFDNCVTFNEDESPVGQAGHNLRAFFETKWDEFFAGASLWNQHLIQTNYLYKIPILGDIWPRFIVFIFSYIPFLSMYHSYPNDHTYTSLPLITPPHDPKTQHTPAVLARLRTAFIKPLVAATTYTTNCSPHLCTLIIAAITHHFLLQCTNLYF